MVHEGQEQQCFEAQGAVGLVKPPLIAGAIEIIELFQRLGMHNGDNVMVLRSKPITILKTERILSKLPW